MKLVVDFGPIHRNTYTLAAALVYGLITNTNLSFDTFYLGDPPRRNSTKIRSQCSTGITDILDKVIVYPVVVVDFRDL